MKKTPNGKKKQDSSDVSDQEVADDTPATARGKRTAVRRNYAQMNGDDSESGGGSDDESEADAYREEDDGVANKRVKVEVSDD